ncbi:uncharacterized protein LOC135396826 [Ornithodoros turicata]|uniref:uncharacterized protein LOC135396826 n=1 Tax=Ornithodoros turicata TaxID=34597 RepID=UPI00313935B9
MELQITTIVMVLGVLSSFVGASTEMYSDICPHCGRLQSIGAPPDGILEMPPPPLPSFLSNWVVGANQSNQCSLCHLLTEDNPNGYADFLHPMVKVDHSWVSTVILVAVSTGVVTCAMLLLACKGRQWKVLPAAETLLNQKEAITAPATPPRNIFPAQRPDAPVSHRSEADGHVYAEPDLSYENSGFLEGAEGYGGPPRGFYGALRHLVPNGYDHLDGPRPHRGRPLPPVPSLKRAS